MYTVCDDTHCLHFQQNSLTLTPAKNTVNNAAVKMESTFYAQYTFFC